MYLSWSRMFWQNLLLAEMFLLKQLTSNARTIPTLALSSRALQAFSYKVTKRCDVQYSAPVVVVKRFLCVDSIYREPSSNSHRQTHPFPIFQHLLTPRLTARADRVCNAHTR